MTQPCRACGKPGKYWYSYELAIALGLLEWEGIYLCTECLKETADDDGARRLRERLARKRPANKRAARRSKKPAGRDRKAKSRARPKRSKRKKNTKEANKGNGDKGSATETPLDILDI